ncbi:hypothetical protein [Nocardia sp. SC052]|uniref:hypothetical protein n=1 Tax=Nocardia sichangensis TaxID=3385975 RepID=UPI00399F7435
MTRNNHTRRRDVRAYMARHGVTYTQALRALAAEVPPEDQPAPSSASLFRVRPADRGGPSLPAVVTGEHDVNPVCGHWLGSRCDGCGMCTTCDGCYCTELRREAEDAAWIARLEREHAEHLEAPDEDCGRCEDDRARSKDFTECPTCHKPLQGFWHFREHCPPYCYRDNPHPPGLDWSYLIGKRITIDNHWCYQGKMAQYAAAWTGTVTGRWKHPDTGAETDYYELLLDPNVAQPRTDLTTTAFDPREFTITEH